MSAVAHVSELAQSMDPLQYVRASPQGIPDEHLNPSPEVVRLVHAPAGDTIGEGYTCTVRLPSSLPPEGVGMVNLANARHLTAAPLPRRVPASRWGPLLCV